MGIEASGEADAWIEYLSSVLRKSLTTEGQPGIDELHIGPLPERIINHSFVLIYSNGARRVHEVTSCFGFGIHAINSAQDKLFLQMREKGEVPLRLYEVDVNAEFVGKTIGVTLPY